MRSMPTVVLRALPAQLAEQHGETEWWKALKGPKTVEELQALARLEGVPLSGAASALAAARGGNAATPASSPAKRAAEDTPSPRDAVARRPSKSPRRRSASPPASVRRSRSRSPRPAAAASSPSVKCPGGGLVTLTLDSDSDANSSVASGKTFYVKDLLSSLGFRYAAEPLPRWELSSLADDEAIAQLRAACAKAGLQLRVVRGTPEPLPPAPVCPVHHKPCRLLTAGPNAMPHNVGRRFWTCPLSTPDTRDECTWVWEDGSAPYSEQSQARFDQWAGGRSPFCLMAEMLGGGCGCGCDACDDYDDACDG